MSEQQEWGEWSNVIAIKLDHDRADAVLIIAEEESVTLADIDSVIVSERIDIPVVVDVQRNQTRILTLEDWGMDVKLESRYGRRNLRITGGGIF